MLDLSKPEHREALRWACRNREAAALVGPLGLPNAPEAVAARALSSPAESAAIVRALLEGCGVDVERLNPRPMQRARGAGPFVDIVGWGADDEKWRGADMANVPALVLRLLDADSSDEHHARCSKCLQPCTFTPVFPSGFDFQCAVHGEVYSATRQQKALAALREV